MNLLSHSIAALKQNSGLHLKTVDELWVLPVRQVVKLLALNLNVTWLSTHRCLLLVLTPAPPVNEKYIQQADAVAHHNSDFCRQVSRGVLGLEDLRPDDVAYTVADEVHGCNSGLLGPSCHVGRDEGENGDKRCWRPLSKVVTDEFSHTLVVIEACNQQHADNRTEHADGRDEQSIAKSVTYDSRGDKCDDLASNISQVQKLRCPWPKAWPKLGSARRARSRVGGGAHLDSTTRGSKQQRLFTREAKRYD